LPGRLFRKPKCFGLAGCAIELQALPAQIGGEAGLRNPHLFIAID
jgi:hypothetical protein